MKEYFRKPYMTQGITKHHDYMKAIPQKSIDVQGQIAPNIEFKKPYDYQPNTAQMIHYYSNSLSYLGGDPVPPLNDPSLLPHAPVIASEVINYEYIDAIPGAAADDGTWATNGSYFRTDVDNLVQYGATFDYQMFVRFPSIKISKNKKIVSAIVTFVGNSSTGAATVNCYFNSADNAIAPTGWADAEAKTLTIATPWATPNWNVGWVRKTPNLKTSLQEIFDRTGWSYGSAIMLIIKATVSGGGFFAQGYSYGITPTIRIEYEK
jgi:hypothetical protein